MLPLVSVSFYCALFPFFFSYLKRRYGVNSIIFDPVSSIGLFKDTSYPSLGASRSSRCRAGTSHPSRRSPRSRLGDAVCPLHRVERRPKSISRSTMIRLARPGHGRGQARTHNTYLTMKRHIKSRSQTRLFLTQIGPFCRSHDRGLLQYHSHQSLT